MNHENRFFSLHSLQSSKGIPTSKPTVQQHIARNLQIPHQQRRPDSRAATTECQIVTYKIKM
jgi:hypothetical protein